MTTTPANKTAAEVHSKRATGIAAVVDEATRMRVEADRAVASADEAVQLCQAAAGAAEAAHAKTPGDDGARVLAAHDALKLAHVRLEAAKKRATEAAEGETGARDALAQAEREAHVTDLLERASPETLAKKTAAPWAAALEAFDLAEAKVAEIYAAYRESVAASSELRANGKYVHDLAVVHAVLPLIQASIGRGLVANNLHSLSPNFDANADPVAEVFALRRALKKQEGQGANNAWLVRQVANLASCRTTSELDTLEREHAKEEQAKVADAYVAPPTPRRTPAAPRKPET